MANNLDLLFPGMEIESCELFRVTRNANTERDEEHADDLLAMIETELRERKFAPIVRLEVGRGMDPPHRGMLAAELGLDEEADVFEVDGMLAMRDLMELVGARRTRAARPPHHPVDHPGSWSATATSSTPSATRARSCCTTPTSRSPRSVERFLREASRDPKVRAIKMTSTAPPPTPRSSTT